ncbi:hypothetical protein AB0C93_04505 [Streptomyces sp. NPDC048518]|uniref:hypothetical protein n=1 Tax=Streptomyces sp. NPDC048518 TaxID=3155029 RepID=UPI0033E321EE
MSSGSDYDDDDDDSYGSSSGSSTGGSSTSGGSGSSGGRSGGGAYNRRPNHDSTASSSPGGHALRDAKVKLLKCASPAAPYATVRVTNSNDRTSRFYVSVTFVDAAGITVRAQTEKVKVPGNSKVTARVKVGDEGLVESVDHCEVEPQALPVSS